MGFKAVQFHQLHCESTMGLGRVLPFSAASHTRRFGSFSSDLSRPISLLSIGRDIDVLRERESDLDKAGYRVRSIKAESFISQRIIEQNMIAVFCHTLSSEECLFLATHFRRYAPASRLILLTHGDRNRLESVLFHAIVRTEDGPTALCQQINRLAEGA
jgi:hypothetical protein